MLPVAHCMSLWPCGRLVHGQPVATAVRWAVGPGVGYACVTGVGSKRGRAAPLHRWKIPRCSAHPAITVFTRARHGKCQSLLVNSWKDCHASPRSAQRLQSPAHQVRRLASCNRQTVCSCNMPSPRQEARSVRQRGIVSFMLGRQGGVVGPSNTTARPPRMSRRHTRKGPH